MSWFDADGYWLGRLLFERILAVVYVLGFVGAVNQFRPLLGSRGLLPIPAWLARVPFRRSPSLFHLHYSDRFFAGMCWFGAAISAALALGLANAVPLWAAMLWWAAPWALYVSIVNVGQLWYGFGWESLLCEAGCYAIFLGNDRTAPPLLVLLAVRWLLFRVEFGAGLIKMRGDACWRNLTCLYYHHETQPMPNPASWFFHRLPRLAHRTEVAANHVTQLGVPFFLFAPQPVASIAAAVMIVTQLWLILSGNFAWLNWLTVAAATSAIADDAWHHVLPGSAPTLAPAPAWYRVVVVAFSVLVLILSFWPARNLLARRQLMNASFNRLHLVNAYGAFGSITRIRHEVVLEGLADGTWREYEFKGKPGTPGRLPRQFAPYHLRLDWLMWFVALDPRRGDRWLVDVLERLLCNDRDLLKLLRHNPFPNTPPTAVRALLYRYRFTTWAELRATGDWWHRDCLGALIPPRRRG